MAKEYREGKAKVRVFFAEVEGNDATIQDGLRSLAMALGRAMQTSVAPRVIPSLPAELDNNGALRQPTPFDQSLDPSEVKIETNEKEVFDPEKSFVTTARPRPVRPKIAPSYILVNDLNLRPQNQVSLKEFFEQKNPKDQQQQFAVFVYYLGKTLEVSGININHLYTCFKAVGKRVPKDIASGIRNTSSRKGWIDTRDYKDIRITTSGENFVLHDLPAKISKPS